MKLYLIERSDPVSWDEYIGWVVAAESPAQATEIVLEEKFPGNSPRDISDQKYWSAQTPSYLGEAGPGMPPGIILESFNAG